MKSMMTATAVLALAGTAWAQAEADPPTNLQQFLADGVTPIPVGGTATSTTIVIAGQVHGSGATQVRLSIEIRPTTDPFMQTVTHFSGWVNVNDTTSVTVTGLAPGIDYTWQATTEPT